MKSIQYIYLSNQNTNKIISDKSFSCQTVQHSSSNTQPSQYITCTAEPIQAEPAKR